MRINRARRPEGIVVIAASAGGVQALGKVLAGLPPDFPLPVAIVQHRSAHAPNLLGHVLGRHSALVVKNAEEGERLVPGTVYLAPPRQHLIVRRDQSLGFVDGRKIRHLRSSANPLFASAAQTFGDGVIAVVLTGGDRDATDGVQTVKGRGGIVIAQDEPSSVLFSMPQSAIETGCVDAILPLHDIAPEIERLARRAADPMQAKHRIATMLRDGT